MTKPTCDHRWKPLYARQSARVSRTRAFCRVGSYCSRCGDHQLATAAFRDLRAAFTT